MQPEKPPTGRDRGQITQEDEADKYIMSKGVEYFTPYYRSEWLQAMIPLYKNHPEWDDLITRIRETC